VRFVLALIALAACSPTTTSTTTDFSFDGTCVKCHLGLSSGHTHPSYKLRCIDCHGGNDQVEIPDDVADVAAGSATDAGKYRDPALLKQVHVLPKTGLARFFFANGVDDDGDGLVDEPPVRDAANTRLTDLGEVFEPGLHGEGPGEFVDSELQRDLNYTRFVNPGDLRVATIGCGGRSRGALDSGTGCHQETVDILRRSIMVNQTAVINGAYYGNESWRATFINGRAAANAAGFDPRAGAFAYGLDYDGADACIDLSATGDGEGGRGQPAFSAACLEQRAAMVDPAVATGAPGNANLPAFELAQGTLGPVPGAAPETTLAQTGADPRQDRLPWGGTHIADPTAERAQLAPVPNETLVAGVQDPVDTILRTFRAYYPVNYPGSTVNQNFTFGSSILPDTAKFKTNDPFGRGHSSGCSACHASYRYDGSRDPTPVVQDDGTVQQVVDPTTKHREFDPATQDGTDELVGRAVSAAQQQATGRAQQKTYAADHVMTAGVTTDQCGLCHGFVTRINYAYQGMAEEEQRDALARRAPIEMTTPRGTHVRILDSWVREEHAADGSLIAVRRGAPAAEDVIAAAKARDAMLAAQGFVAGNGGCAPNVFTEDCNNDGELESSLVLTHVDVDGTARTLTIDEDGNGNGALDLIDRVPREASVDGRQLRYVYGGRNGSTRLMDVHFERGMQCIDCHFLQDVHGDGHLYSTNWDHIEIECEDCHGAAGRATLVTSGPNGGNDLTRAKDRDGVPYFQVVDGKVTQRSRVTPGVTWTIPQTADLQTGLAKEAHSENHVAPPGQGSTFAGAPGHSALSSAKVECATCHSSWIHNCLGCHIDLNQGDLVRTSVQPDGSLIKTAAENEIWLSNAPNPAHINFQLLGLMRAPFVLGVTGSSEAGRLATFRSSMEAHVTVTDANGNTAIDNATFTTFQDVDGNSGRTQVATSAAAMNQTMPHTVRPVGEERGCETCHALVDAQQHVRNEHELAQTYGLGAGAIPYLGDWAIAAGASGIELYDYKQERELATNRPGASTRFPGMIASDCDRVASRVEPIFDGSQGITAGSIAQDVLLVRNFNPTPAPGQTAPPTLRDLAIVGVATGAAGTIIVSDITARGNPASTRPSIGDKTREFVLAVPGIPRSLAHLGPDVSDPFVYAAVGAAGISVVELVGAPTPTVFAARLDRTVPLASHHTATALALAGDLLYVGTSEGTLEIVNLADPRQPVSVGTPVTIGSPVNALALEGFVLYAATPGGVAALGLDDPQQPAPLSSAGPIVAPGIAANELVATGGHVYVAAGSSGVIDLDVRTAAAPVNLGNLAATLAPGQTINAADVVLSVMPGQSWLLVLDATGELWGLKLDGRKSLRERCYPDPKAAGCELDLGFLDATQSGRDPSFDPAANAFDDGNCADRAANPFVDPSAKTFLRFPRTIITSGRRLARGAVWEQIGTLTGRRVRDSFMPGSGVLSLPVMQAMRRVQLCESAGASNEQGSLGALGYADAAFFATGTCQPLGQSARARTAPPPPFAPAVRAGVHAVAAGAMIGEMAGNSLLPALALAAVLASLGFVTVVVRRRGRRRAPAVSPDLARRVLAASEALRTADPWRPSAQPDAPEAAAAIEAELIAGAPERAVELAEAAVAAAPDDARARLYLAWALCASGHPAAARTQLGDASGPLAGYLDARIEHLAFEHAAGATGAVPPLVTAGDVAVVTLAHGQGGAWLTGGAETSLSPEQIAAALAEHREVTARCLDRALAALAAAPGFADAGYLVARLAIKAGAVTAGRALFDALAPRMLGRPDAEAFARDRAALDDPTSAVAAATRPPAPGKAKRSPRLRVLP
jgi:hypothetical protein